MASSFNVSLTSIIQIVAYWRTAKQIWHILFMSRQLNIELRSDSIYFSRNIETSRNVVNVKGSSTSNDWVNGGNFWYGNVQNLKKKKNSESFARITLYTKILRRMLKKKSVRSMPFVLICQQFMCLHIFLTSKASSEGMTIIKNRFEKKMQNRKKRKCKKCSG